MQRKKCKLVSEFLVFDCKITYLNSIIKLLKIITIKTLQIYKNSKSSSKHYRFFFAKICQNFLFNVVNSTTKCLLRHNRFGEFFPQHVFSSLEIEIHFLMSKLSKKEYCKIIIMYISNFSK